MLARLKRIDGGITRGGAPLRAVDMVLPGDEIVLRLSDTSFLDANPDLNVPVCVCQAKSIPVASEKVYQQRQ